MLQRRKTTGSERAPRRCVYGRDAGCARAGVRRWIALGVLAAIPCGGAAQSAAMFTRPGTMIVIDVFGEPTVVARGETKLLKLEDRLRAELTFKMPRRSTVTVELGNGAQLRVGSDSEVTVEEFWQQPHSKSGKMAEWKEEPSGSRTLVRLDRGDLAVKVKPLQVARGSSFTVELIAGALRITAGEVRARVQMTELGLGLCTLHLLQGAAELEAAGGKVILLKPGERLSLPIEVDARGNVKVGEMPKAETAKRKE